MAHACFRELGFRMNTESYHHTYILFFVVCDYASQPFHYIEFLVATENFPAVNMV